MTAWKRRSITAGIPSVVNRYYKLWSQAEDEAEQMMRERDFYYEYIHLLSQGMSHYEVLVAFGIVRSGDAFPDWFDTSNHSE